MVLTGILRHYATILLQATPKPLELAALREQRSLQRGMNLRNNYAQLSSSSFNTRKDFLVAGFKDGAFLKDPDSRGKPAANPMTDPAAMEGMMGMMKGNMVMMVPQTIIMGWINAFFSGYVIMKLPFPLTIRFKSMLQSGIATRDLDSVFIFLLGNDNAASQMTQQMAQMSPGTTGAGFQPGQDPDKMFKAEAENLEVIEHWSVMDGIEDRVVALLS
ncbi:ER membrane complex subunit 3 [Agyrium rufum]|nr:ER membrane complex subunit 3 [Agyrium rufum]